MLRTTIGSLLLALLTGCGLNGTQTLKVTDSEQRVIQEGESYTYVVVRLEFIQQVKELCEGLHNDIEDETTYERTVAQCTFDRLALINVDLGAITDTQQEICQRDVSTLTPEELEVFNAICALQLLP